MKNTIIITLVLAIVLFGGGFYFGRSTIKPEIKYVEGPTVFDTIRVPEPYEILVPAKPILPLKPDTVWKDSITYIPIYDVDTAKIISEYIKLRKYKKQLFDNTDGRLSVDLNVQYNKLTDLNYSYTPITKEITQLRKYIFYVKGSINTFGYYGIGGGVFKENIGVGAKLISDGANKGAEIELGYKF